MKNIVLIGMPGSGKTKIGKLLAAKLARPFVDVDKLIGEKTGKDSAKHLADLGDDGFLAFEAKIVRQINHSGAVIASSGSVPLKEEGIEHLKQNGVLVWMDIPLEIIAARVNKRSGGTSRIVGAQTMTLEEIMAFRREKYEQYRDLHFTIAEEKPAECVLDALHDFLRQHEVC